ncbi:MAG: hypothetical protein DDT19_01426 [Syntrophomonadaceae bacterium]|nr:hypothetical protein [Bacillota bacterium]
MRGFTFFEILVVTGLFSVLIALGLFMSMETFRGSIYRSEQATVVSVLQKARSRAMANIDQSPWGVYYDPIANAYFIFRGGSYTPGATNEKIPGNAAVTVTGLFLPGVVFSQLSGTTTATTTAVVQDGRTSTISINYEGAINW